MKTAEEINWLYDTRRNARTPVINMMDRVRRAYNSDIAVPVSELWADEEAAVANLVVQGIDGTAQRIASTQPEVYFKATKPGDLHEKAARRKREVVHSWWDYNDQEILRSRRARHFGAMGCAPMVMRPNIDTMIPEWHLRHPMSAFPAKTHRMDELLPPDCIFMFTLTFGEIRRLYEDKIYSLQCPKKLTDETEFECLEYIDADEIVLVVRGQGETADPWTAGAAIGMQRPDGTAAHREMQVEVSRTRNWAGVPLVSFPGRITLDKMMGQADAQLGKYAMRSKLMALNVLAIEDGIFPNEWIVTADGASQQAKIITVADGRNGIIGEIQGGTIIANTRNPGYKTDDALNRIEREERIDGHVSAAQTGESASNVRTGRYGNDVLAQQIDFQIQEAQRVLAKAEQHEIEMGINIVKSYHKGKTISMFVSMSGESTGPTYVPEKLFDNDRVRVAYPLAGTDVNQFVVRSSQKVGAEIWSKQTAREKDPEVEDADFEDRQIIVESLVKAQLASVGQLIVAGQLSGSDNMRLIELIQKKKMDFVDAWNQVQEEAQQRAATEGAPGEPDGPVDPNSPEAQAGMNVPGAGGEAGTVAPVGPPSESEGHLSMLRNQLRGYKSSVASA